MRIFQWIWMSMMVLTMVSCTQQETADYEFFVTTQTTIPSGLNNIETHVFVIPDVYPFLAANLQAKGTDISRVTSITPGRAELYDRFNSTQLGFIRDVSVRARKIDDPQDYVELFKLDNVNINEGNRIALLNTLNDIEDWIDEDEIEIELRLRLRGFSPHTLSLGMDFSYAVFVDE